jgi:hypothetical protein
VLVLNRRGTREQHAALLHILGGEDTEPGATIFQIFSITCGTVYKPIVSDIEFELDIAHTARARIDGVLETRGAPILNLVTGSEHRVRIEQPEGVEFAVAEVGRGWSKTAAPFTFELDDTYGQFADIHLCQSGIVR